MGLLKSDIIFVGSWAGGQGVAFRCPGCGDDSKQGVNITIANEELNLCNACSAEVRSRLDKAERTRDGFDDIRFGY